MERRVVVTGYGVVSPLGSTVEEMWKEIIAGSSGIQRLEDAEFASIPTRIGGRVKGFDPSIYMDKKEQKRYDRFIQYGYAAAMQAIDQADLNHETIDRSRIGIYMGTGSGGMDTTLENHSTFLDRGPRRVSPFMVPMMISNMAGGIIAIKTGFTGPSYSPMSACATGNQAIGEAFLNIKHGYSDAIVAGGSEAMMNPLAYAGFSRMGAMSTNNEEPEKASRPFDQQRDGFVMGEGAGVLVLEAYEHAKKRGAKILGEVVGYGATTDAYHITSPNSVGAERAMHQAIEMAGIDKTEVQYINAHGTSTPEGDISEAQAIKRLFHTHTDTLLVSSTKSMTGHMFGAAGGMEAIITLKSMENNVAPPTINYDTPDEECPLHVVPNEATQANIPYALSNGFGFGGHNAVIAFKKWD